MITTEQLREILHYDPDTGIFTWAKKTSNKVVVGRHAGAINLSGYIVIGIGGKLLYAHRLAFTWMGEETPDTVDHADGDRLNNRWSNLRPATDQQNVLNAKLASNSTSGFKGVSWHKKAQKWSAQIYLDGKSRYLGLYTDPKKAHDAYMRAANSIQPEFARAS
ncbi:HNH endonuclease [Rhizobium esperanzae]|uniref:AP2/ERF domain-containing protein n=1 Tax=Rhizobium esperanzae TaxID=1967781 RepID=A0A7W6R1D8_9HYPH|nr:HNH endonuclease [Rhizobium esperanzae]MBB4235066.1 hypothetical protein [Rhizobium esperanzae]